MSPPPKVRRCPYCRGPVFLRQETWQQYRVLCYGCSRCELEIPGEDIAPDFSDGIPDDERQERLKRFQLAASGKYLHYRANGISDEERQARLERFRQSCERAGPTSPYT